MKRKTRKERRMGDGSACIKEGIKDSATSYYTSFLTITCLAEGKEWNKERRGKIRQDIMLVRRKRETQQGEGIKAMKAWKKRQREWECMRE